MAHNMSPEEALKILEKMSVDEIRDGIIQTCRRQARAEVDLKYYSDSYKAVIKEEKETRLALIARLETLMEADRIRSAREKWLDSAAIKNQVEERRVAAESGGGDSGESTTPSKAGGFLKAVEDDVDVGDAGEEPPPPTP